MARAGLVLLFCLAVGHSAYAEDAGLNALSAKLIAIRGTHGVNTMRDAGPELTPIKHALRVWVESRLQTLTEHSDPDKFAKRLSDLLRAANLTCDGGKPDEKRCVDGEGSDDARGYLSGIGAFYLREHYVSVQTNVGVRCGFDSSLYIYEWHPAGWKLVLQSEQDRYSERQYAAQNFFAVRFASESDFDKSRVGNPPLILTVGYSPWCQSNWQTLYARLWRVSPTNPSPAPLMDEANTYFFDDESWYARLAPEEAFVEFSGTSIDGDNLVRTHVLHYAIEGDKAERIGPVALNPNDFVDEWLTRPWAEGAAWASKPSVFRKWYDSFHADDFILGEFEGPPLRCQTDPMLWQVGFTEDAGPKNPELSAHFLVRWMAPYRFTLVKIQKTKFPGCDVKDAMPDNPGTLFPFPSSPK